MRRLRLALFTALASITIAEFTTGATALTAIFTNPGSFFLFSIPALFGLYGCGVILIREVSIIWNKGWPSILSLGVAYGIMEEGVAVHTFFEPVTHTVGIFGEYGKFFTLNVTWAILISLFHAVFSIALPILIGHLLWPESKKQRLLTRRSGTSILFLYLLTVAALFIVVPYKPSFAWLIVLLLISSILFYAARKLNHRVFRRDQAYAGVRTGTYLLAGLIYFPLLIVFPRLITSLPSVITDAILIVAAVLIYRSLEKKLPGNDQRKLAVMTVGMLLPLQAFGAILNISTNPLQLLAVAVLAYLEYRILKSTEFSLNISEVNEPQV